MPKETWDRFKFIYEEEALQLEKFFDEETSRPGGSAPGMGFFMDPKTGEKWLGKLDLIDSRETSLMLACQEKLANELYGFYGIRVPRLRISRQQLSKNYRNLISNRENAEGAPVPSKLTRAFYVMSRWVDRFNTYGEFPSFKDSEQQFLNINDYPVPEKGLGHILAVAHWINDIDVLGPRGGNIGYQLQLDSKTDQLYALSCKIDPGSAFANFKSNDLVFEERIRLCKNDPQYISFKDLSQQTQLEYLSTVKAIVDTPDHYLKTFLQDKQDILFNNKVKHREECLSSEGLFQQLLQRKNYLKKLYAKKLQTLTLFTSPIQDNTLPILQRLQAQAQFTYEAQVKEKLNFYIPLDVSHLPHAEQGEAIGKCVEVFLASSKETLLLLGPSGSGKSLYTQQLVQKLWEKYLQEESYFIPMRIELKQFGERTVGQCVINALLDEYHYSFTEIKELQQHRFLFILDGYDEISSQAKVNLLQKHYALENQYGPWKGAKFIITCRDRYFYDLDRKLFYGSDGESGLEIRYLLGISKEKQIQYLMDYRKGNAQKNLPNYETLLKENSHLYEILANPLVLCLFRDALPLWQKANPQKSLNELTQYALYTAFMEQWFASEAVRLCMQKTQVFANLPEKFLKFSLSLAKVMHEQKVDEVNQQMTEDIWNRFFRDAENAEARMGCPLKRQNNTYSFVHKSFLEYFVARLCWEALLQSLKEDTDLAEIWPMRLLSESPVILDFLREVFGSQNNQTQECLRKKLWLMVQQSKLKRDDELIVTAAANAITLLSAIETKFVGVYGAFGNVSIRGADLQGALLDHADLSGADLTRVNFSSACLRKANLQKANLTNVQFGEQPYLQHKNPVLAVCYSSDDRWLITASGRDIFIWDAETKELKKKTNGEHTDPITCFALSADGKILVSGSDDHTLIVWDVTGGVCQKKILEGHAGEIICLALSTDGKTLIFSGNENNSLNVWNLDSEVYQKTLQGHSDLVTCLALGADGKTLVSGSKDTTVKIWDLTSGVCQKTLHGHTNEVSCLALRNDGKTLISGSWDATFRIWNLDNGVCQKTLRGHTSTTPLSN